MNVKTEPVDFKNDRLLQFITDRKYKIYRHIILLSFLTVTFLNSKDPLFEPANTYFKTGIFAFLISLFYLNIYWLVPRLIFKQRYLAYMLWVVILLGITLLSFIVAHHYIKPYFKDPFHEGGDLASTAFPFSFFFFVFIGACSAIKLFQRSIVTNQRINELETATMHAELEQLKNQINPHFLFNTLNNVNVLTQKDAQKASQVIMKLSDLLRYQLYDSTRSKVLLSADIRFLEDFLNLEKIRRDNFEFEIISSGELSGVQVAPLLFITFVENAVKHNLDTENSSYVHMLFTVADHQLSFTCINSKPESTGLRRFEGGLGLVNVARRLNLLYPDKHTLHINNNDTVFRIDLKLTL